MESEIKVQTLRPKADFEKLGFDTMMETREHALAVEICGLKLHAFADELQPEIKSATNEIATTKIHHQSLCAFLYDRAVPISDGEMLGKKHEFQWLHLLLVITIVASLAGHMTTFILSGMGVLLSLLIGAGVTGLCTIAGYMAFEKLISSSKTAERILIAIAFALCFWGIVQFAQARGLMAYRLIQTNPTSSYVSDPGTDADDTAAQPGSEASEHGIRQLLGSAMTKVMISADLVLGMFLAMYMRLRSDADLAAWREVEILATKLCRLQNLVDKLNASIETAKKRCMAGILRATALQGKAHSPYHRALPIVIVVILGACAVPAFAREKIARHEGILIDVSGSIGSGTGNRELFREYLQGVKKLLATEPPRSRVWVGQITTDSFGGSAPLLRAWTPDVQGVFNDDLNRARRQLVSSFEAKSASMTPVAAGTDIFGGLFAMKTLLESGSHAKSADKEVWIFSDMMNETAQLNMPALISRGPEQMLVIAKSRGLVVDLTGYHVHILGVALSSSTPSMWSTSKRFWEQYFKAAGATLVTYSAENEPGR